MSISKLTSIEDIKKYVAAHDEYVSLAWEEMLVDMDVFGEEYLVSDFLEEAGLCLTRGKVTFSLW